MKNEMKVRVLVPRGNLDEDKGSRVGYTVFEEDKDRIIYKVPEEEAEEFARRTGGLMDLSE